MKAETSVNAVYDRDTSCMRARHRDESTLHSRHQCRGRGILGFPNLINFPPIPGKVLHADELNTALQTMKSKNMFKRLVFYVEACAPWPMPASPPSCRTHLVAPAQA